MRLTLSCVIFLSAGVRLLIASSGQTQTINAFVVPNGTYSFYLNTSSSNTCGGYDIALSNPKPSMVVETSPTLTGLTTHFSGVAANFTFTGVAVGTDNIQLFEFDSSPCTASRTINLNFTVVASVPPTDGQTLTATGTAEPVSTATGEFYGYDDTADLAIDGPLALTFRRYYASFLSANGVSSALGTNWMSNFDISLAIAGTAAKATLFRGKTVSFNLTGGVWQLSSNEQRPWQLIADGSGYQLLDPRSNRIYTFNSTGALSAIQDRNGNPLTVTPGSNGPTAVADGLGRTLTLTYTGSSLTKVQDQSGRAVTFAYTGSNLTSFTDANGKVTAFAYTSAGGFPGLMTSATLPNGNQPYTQTYDSQGRVATQTHGFGNSITFTYNAGTNGLTSALTGGPTLTYTHDSNFNLTAVTDSNSIGSTNTYDAKNRLLSTTDRTGATSSVTYDPASGLPATYSDALGNKTTFAYASTTSAGFTFYDLSGITFADSTAAAYTRDIKGNVTAFTDQAGKIWNFTYNSAGQVATATNPSAGVTTMAYGADATLTSVQLPSGDTTTLAYDTAKRPDLLTNPDNSTVSSQYNGLDNVTGSTDERGDASALSVDSNDNLHTVTDAVAAVTTFAYDADDRLTSVTDALSHAISRVYDANSRLQSVTDSTSVSISYVYDSLNRPTQVLDAAGKGLTLAWDQEARLTSSTDALSRTTGFIRDARGLVTAVTSPKSETFSVGYDALARPISKTDPLGGVTTLAYEPRGLLSSLTLPGAISSAYTFNELGNLTSATDPNGNPWATGRDKLGRPISRTDPLARTTSLQYDSRQRVSAVSYPQIGGNPAGFQNTYDAANNLTARAYTDGTNLAFNYDADNRITGGTGFAFTWDLNGRLNGSNGLTISRDSAGRIASITYATGKTVSYAYDNRGLLTQVADWIGGVTSFAYDAAHQLTSRTFPNGVVETFAYDADGRVTSIQINNGATAISSIALTRDALGRVTSATGAAPTVAPGFIGFAYDAASQSTTPTYDPLGRVTQDPLSARSYTWDLASRLTSYSGATGAVSFTYDGFGQRISRSTGGVTQNYVLNYALPLPSVATVQTGGADLRYYVWLPGGTLLESIEASGGARHFYHFDENGTTNFLTTDSGAVTDTYAVTPYGETVVQTGTTPNPFTFHGAYGVMQEGATGLYYMRARYYDSTSARFLSRDPLVQADPRAIDPYQFVYANPIEGVDPAGLNPDNYLSPWRNGLEDYDPNLGPQVEDITSDDLFTVNVYITDWAWFGDPEWKPKKPPVGYVSNTLFHW